MKTLPDCDKLFLRFFDRWYDEKIRHRRGFKATLPDIIEYNFLVGRTQPEASCLTQKTQQKVMRQIAAMVDAAREDWPHFLSVKNEIDFRWIDAFDRHFTRKRIFEVIKRSDPSQFDNDYIVLCCEFGAILGHVLCAAQPRLVWRLEWPYWDSSLLDPKTGSMIPTFHWAIKKMSDYGVDDGFVAKVKACVKILNQKKTRRHT